MKQVFALFVLITALICVRAAEDFFRDENNEIYSIGQWGQRVYQDSQRQEETTFDFNDQSNVIEFGWELFQKSNFGQQGNFVLSPLSPQILLSHVKRASFNKTRNEIERSIKYQSTGELAGLIDAMLNENTGRQLDIANAFFVSQQLKLKEKYENGSKRFGIDIKYMDFSNPQKVQETYSRYINEKTKGRLSEQKLEINANTRMILSSAIYFKGDWIFKFPNTHQGTFFVPFEQKQHERKTNSGQRNQRSPQNYNQQNFENADDYSGTPRPTVFGDFLAKAKNKISGRKNKNQERTQNSSINNDQIEDYQTSSNFNNGGANRQNPERDNGSQSYNNVGNVEENISATPFREPSERIPENSTPITVEMMQLRKNFHWGLFNDDKTNQEIAEWVSIPYNSTEAMVIILPRFGKTLDEIVESIEVKDIKALIESISEHNSPNANVDLTMPKFKIESALSLIDPLRRMGIYEIFSPNSQFYPLQSSEPLNIANAIQQTSLEVNEQGSVAASATAFSVAALSIAKPIRNTKMVVNRPFIAMIVDRKYKVPYFIAKVINPSKPK